MNQPKNPINSAILILSLFLAIPDIGNTQASNIEAGYIQTGNTEGQIKSYHASYQLYWNGLAVGLSDHIVKELGANHFWAQSHSFPKLSFLPFEDFEQGEFIQHNKEFRPIHYIYRSRSNRKRLEGKLTFDWQHLKVIKESKEEPEAEALIPLDAKDKITFFFQLRETLRAGGKEFQYTIIEPKKVSHWHMEIIGEETLQTPLGKFNTIKLENRLDKGDRITQFWVAKELDYILVKLVQYQKGKKRAEAMIKEIDLGVKAGQ